MAMKEHDEGLQQSVSDQAAEWFIRLQDRDLTMADRRKFVRWLKQAPSHIARNRTANRNNARAFMCDSESMKRPHLPTAKCLSLATRVNSA